MRCAHIGKVLYELCTVRCAREQCASARVQEGVVFTHQAHQQNGGDNTLIRTENYSGLVESLPISDPSQHENTVRVRESCNERVSLHSRHLPARSLLYTTAATPSLRSWLRQGSSPSFEAPQLSVSLVSLQAQSLSASSCPARSVSRSRFSSSLFFTKLDQYPGFVAAAWTVFVAADLRFVMSSHSSSSLLSAVNI